MEGCLKSDWGEDYEQVRGRHIDVSGKKLETGLESQADNDFFVKLNVIPLIHISLFGPLTFVFTSVHSFGATVTKLEKVTIRTCLLQFEQDG